MNISFNTTNQVKTALLEGELDFSLPGSGGDTFKVLLMREGFSFRPDTHLYKKNIKKTASVTFTCNGTNKTINRTDAGDFLADGFCIGNYITTAGTNTGTYRIDSVTALTIRVSVVTGTFVTAVEATANIVSDDEHDAVQDEYVKDTVTCTFEISGTTLILNTINEETSFGTAISTSSGFVIYDDTHANDIILGFARLSPVYVLNL